MEKATIPQEKDKSLRVSVGLWKRLKQRALDDGITVRELVERGMHQYLGSLGNAMSAGVVVMPTKEGHRIVVQGDRAAYVPEPEKHWTPDE